MKPGSIKLVKGIKNKLTTKELALVRKLVTKMTKLQTKIWSLYPDADTYKNKDVKALQAQRKEIENRVSLVNDELIKYIETNCSDFLKHLKTSKKFLYRGIKGTKKFNPNKPFVGRSPVNRKPRDSSKLSQEMFDNYLLSKGFTALRSNSIFATSNYTRAWKFGNVYLIFPKNGFSYTWTKLSDVVLDTDIKYPDLGIFKKVKRQANNAATKYYKLYRNADTSTEGNRYKKISELFTNLSHFCSEMQYNNDHVELTVQTHTKIKEIVQKFMNLNIQIDGISFKELTKDLIFDFSVLEPSKKNLHIAMSKGREVFICGEYVAIPFFDLNNSNIEDKLKARFLK